MALSSCRLAPGALETLECPGGGLVDAHGLTGKVPALLDQVEREEAPEAWEELWDRLCLQHGATVSPASFTALPRLAILAPTRAPALELAGAIVRGTLQQPDGELCSQAAGCGGPPNPARRWGSRSRRGRQPSAHPRRAGQLVGALDVPWQDTVRLPARPEDLDRRHIGPDHHQAERPAGIMRVRTDPPSRRNPTTARPDGVGQPGPVASRRGPQPSRRRISGQTRENHRQATRP